VLLVEGKMAGFRDGPALLENRQRANNNNESRQSECYQAEFIFGHIVYVSFGRKL
jgi:hypothetical protein